MKNVLRIPRNVYGGQGSIKYIEEIFKNRKKKAVIFSDKGIRNAGLLEEVIQRIKNAGMAHTIIDEIPAEPTYMQAQKVIEKYQEQEADLIVAVGGGSVMDIAKLACVANGPGFSVKRLLKDPVMKKQVETLMIPTTAGTGSEATPNSIVEVPEQQVKIGIVNNEMIADYVILDSEMIRNLPRHIAASTGVDALAHAIECYTSKKANVFSDMFSLEALELILNNIEKACDDRQAMEEKTAMMNAAFYAGVAITASGTTAVHALSYPLGGKYHIPHGVANSMLLAPVMRFNAEACAVRFEAAYNRINGKIFENRKKKVEWIVKRLEEIVKNLDIPSNLRECGIDMAELDELTESGLQVRRLLDNNIRPVTYEDAKKIYSEIL